MMTFLHKETEYRNRKYLLKKDHDCVKFNFWGINNKKLCMLCGKTGKRGRLK